MNTAQRFAALAASTTILVTPMLASSPQDRVEQDLTDQPAVIAPVIDFGHPTSIAPGPSNHVLLPNEVTIFKGDTVTFRMNGPTHGIAIYPVSKNTTREDIAADLCTDGSAACAANAAGRGAYTITDGDGQAIVLIPALVPGEPLTPIDHEPGQVVSAGAGAFLVGTRRDPADPTGTRTLAGTLVRARFPEDGRYLVLCMNRPHTINDWMFGFVNVTTAK